MVKAACVQYRAFSQELPPETFSRDGRMTALKVYGVFAPDELRRSRRIAGGTAEGYAFRPGLGMTGFFYCLFPEKHK